MGTETNFVITVVEGHTFFLVELGYIYLLSKMLSLFVILKLINVKPRIFDPWTKANF